ERQPLEIVGVAAFAVLLQRQTEYRKSRTRTVALRGRFDGKRRHCGKGQNDGTHDDCPPATPDNDYITGKLGKYQARGSRCLGIVVAGDLGLQAFEQTA